MKIPPEVVLFVFSLLLLGLGQLGRLVVRDREREAEEQREQLRRAQQRQAVPFENQNGETED